MMPPVVKEQAPIPPPSYQRAQARLGPALHIDALTLVTTLHLLTLCRLAVRLAHRRCPPPLPAGPGGAPLIYSEESLLLIGLLRTLWRLSYQDMHDWLKSWPALALACGLPLDKEGHPRIPSKSQQCKRRHAAGAPLHESLFVLTVLQAVRSRLIGARDLIIDSAPILAWRRRDPDAADLACPRSSSSLSSARLSCAYSHLSRFRTPSLFPAFSCQFTRCPFCAKIIGRSRALLSNPSPYCSLGCSLLGLAPHSLDSCCARCHCCYSLESQKPEEPFLLATNLDQRRTRQAQQHRALLWTRFSLFPSPAPTSVWLVRDCFTGRLDLRCFCHCWASSSAGWPSRSHPLSQTCSSSSVGGEFRVMKRPQEGEHAWPTENLGKSSDGLDSHDVPAALAFGP
jgi:hypothetical protein